MVRPTIKQQQLIAQKSRKTKPEPPTDTPETPSEMPPESSTDAPEPPPDIPQKRDKQVTVKFSENDMERLKSAASKARSWER
jgi:hypothetical protein